MKKTLKLVSYFLIAVMAFFNYACDSDDDPIEVLTVSLDKTEITLEIGGTEQLTATLSPVKVDDPSLTWKSNNGEIATVSQTGLVTAVDAGEAVITVSSVNGMLATCKVVVNAPKPETITVKRAADEDLWIGRTETLTVEVTPANADKTVTWSTSDDRVATVDSEGVVTGVAEGTVTIMATSENGKSGSVEINVIEPPFQMPEEFIGNWEGVEFHFIVLQDLGIPGINVGDELDKEGIRPLFVDPEDPEAMTDEEFEDWYTGYACTLYAFRGYEGATMEWDQEVTIDMYGNTELRTCSGTLDDLKDKGENWYLGLFDLQSAGIQGPNGETEMELEFYWDEGRMKYPMAFNQYFSAITWYEITKEETQPASINRIEKSVKIPEMLKRSKFIKR